MKLHFYGADRCVTGSCHCLEINGKRILVDCGLQQGRDELDNAMFAFNPGDIDILLVTHAHIDHTGRIPLLVKRGFTGRILTTRVTADLMRIMLLDSAHIQESDAEYRNRKGLLVFYPSAPSTRRATPFECQKAAKRLLRGCFAAFSCPGCWGYGIAMPEELRSAFGVVNKCGVRPHLWKRRGRRRKGPPARRRSKPKERKFQKGE